MTEFAATSETLKAMLARADEKLRAARVDLDAGLHGDASSRAYYGAYHAIAAVLAHAGMSFSSHAQTLGAFNREFVKPGAFPPDTFRKIQRLFEDRQIADYDWNVTIEPGTAMEDVSAAEWLVGACKEYLRSQGVEM